MATEVTVVLRFEKFPPPEFQPLLEDEFDCIVLEYEEDEDC